MANEDERLQIRASNFKQCLHGKCSSNLDI